MDDYGREKVDEMVLALMQLTLHDFSRVFRQPFGTPDETQDEPEYRR